MLRFYRTDTETQKISRTDIIEEGCWIDMVSPTDEEIATMVQTASRDGTITLGSIEVLDTDAMTAIYRMANH